MFFSCKSSVCYFLYFFVITYTRVLSDDVPTILWNIKGNALHVKPASALGVSDSMLIDSLKDIHNEDSRIIVFTVNKLSLEDFNANDKSPQNNTLHNIESFLDVQPHILLPNVKDPLNYLHESHCGVQEIVVDNKIDENILHLISSALERSCVVILHISDDGIVKKGEVKSVFLPSFENSNKNIVGIFTGVKSSWSNSKSEHHKFRNLLQAPETSDNSFVNYTGCIIMYAENMTLNLGKESNGSVTLPLPPSLNGSSCDNSSSLLQLTFKTSGILSSVTIKFNFTKVRGSWSTIGTVSMTGEKAIADEIDLKTESIGAPLGFSYSCGDLTVTSKNSSFGVSIKIDRFQIQPYQVKDVFSDSFDCIPFFTIPIWMGIFVSLLFIIIANIGIYALFSVHTMDRFDDPKGKTITVTAAAD